MTAFAPFPVIPRACPRCLGKVESTDSSLASGRRAGCTPTYVFGKHRGGRSSLPRYDPWLELIAGMLWPKATPRPVASNAAYSRLMAEDEERTLQTFRAHKEVFEKLVQLHRGRV